MASKQMIAMYTVLASLLLAHPASAQLRPQAPTDAFPLDIQLTTSTSFSITPVLHHSGASSRSYSSTPFLPAYAPGRASAGFTSSNSTTPTLQLSNLSALDSPPRRSPLIAGLLSAAVPGLGQAYADDWSISVRSAAFFAVEAGLWIAAISYNDKGDSQTEIFQRYADEHWDVTRYASWIEANIGGLNGVVNTAGMITSTDPLLAPWERVNWTRINEVEDGIGQKTGTGFTHRLPHRPEQQYYELIGKYSQFGGGWDDAPGFTPQDILASNVSPRFLEYSLMRGRANDLYSNATTATYLIVANHVISALEAAWSTSRANKRVEARAEMRSIDRGGWGERVPHVSITVKLLEGES